MSTKGMKPWNYGLKLGQNPKHSEWMRSKMESDPDFKRRCATKPPGYIVWNKGIKGVVTAWNKGKTKSSDSRIKTPRTTFKEGNKPWNAGLDISDVRVKKIGQATSKRMISSWQDSAYIQKMHDSWKQTPNMYEILLNDMIQENIPDVWEFTGDGSFWITSEGINHNPDFVYKEKRKIIEFCGRYWHSEEEMELRSKRYKKVGWDCFVVWEEAIDDSDSLVRDIIDFSFSGLRG